MEVFILKCHLQESTLKILFIYSFNYLAVPGLSPAYNIFDLPYVLVYVYVCVCVCVCVCLCVCGYWVVSKTWDPMDCSLPCSSILEIFQARILEWIAICFSRDSSQPSDRTHVSSVSCTGRQILCHWVSWEAWGIFSCGMRTLSCSMWDLVPWQWLNLGSLLWDHGTKSSIGNSVGNREVPG